MARRGRYRHGNDHRGRGVYRAINKRTNKPGYVGKAKDIETRTKQHEREGKPFANPKTHRWEHKPLPRSTAKTAGVVEANQIAKHKPKHNLHSGSPGRPWWLN